MLQAEHVKKGGKRTDEGVSQAGACTGFCEVMTRAAQRESIRRIIPKRGVGPPRLEVMGIEPPLLPTGLAAAPGTAHNPLTPAPIPHGIRIGSVGHELAGKAHPGCVFEKMLGMDGVEAGRAFLAVRPAEFLLPPPVHIAAPIEPRPGQVGGAGEGAHGYTIPEIS